MHLVRKVAQARIPTDKALSILYAFILLFSACKGKEEADETSFAIDHPEYLVQINISGQGSYPFTLTKRDKSWYLDDTTLIRPDAMENIMRILPFLRVKFYPPRASWQNMMDAINREGVKLDFVFSDQSVKTIYLGGMTNDERGTYGLVNASRHPYVVHVPGFEGSLASRFIMSRDDWRDRMILRYESDDIDSLQMTYPMNPNESFSIVKSDRATFQLIDYKQQQSKSAIQSNIKLYLGQIKRTGCEGIENSFQFKDSVIHSRPHAILNIKTRTNPLRTIRFYTIREEGLPDSERMFVYDGRDFYLAQIRILQKIFRPFSYFEGK